MKALDLYWKTNPDWYDYDYGYDYEDDNKDKRYGEINR